VEAAMIGIQKKQEEMFCYGVSLEKRVPPNHPLRKIKQALNLSFVRPAVSQFYGYNGNESVAPEVIVKLMLLLFLDDISSERELMRMLPYRLDYLWFLDYGLDAEVPDHSVLSKARRKWGMPVFKQLFVQSVEQCVEAGLVSGSKIFVDGSLVDANASCASVRRGSRELLTALSGVYRREERKLESIEEETNIGDGSGSSGSEDPPKSESGYSPVNNNLLCMTDPDAAIVRHGSLPARPRYKNHRAVDESFGVVTAVASTSGAVAENRELMELVEESESNTGMAVETVVGDCQYGTVENFRECGERGIKAHLGDLSEKRRASSAVRSAGIFGDDKFNYDPVRDVYVCPAGNVLKRRQYKPGRRAYYYGCRARLCNGCGLKAQCTRSDHGRTVIRHEGQELIDRVRVEAHSFGAKQDLGRRKHISEGSFADASNNHGFKRSRWRGLWRQGIQDYMIAVCQNLRILSKNLIPDRATAQFRAMASAFSAYFCAQKPKSHCIFNLQPICFGIFGI
jgi:transposase